MGAVRVAVLGAGFMGGTHARAYGQMHGVEVAAIYARSAKRAVPLADEVESRWSDDLDALLADESIDAVDICLPSMQHREVAEQAIASGKHVLLEKPIALTHEDGAALVALAKTTPKVFMIAHVVRFWPEYVEIKRIIDSGVIGKPLSVFAARRQPFPAWSEQFTSGLITGGAILDQMIHDYDIANWLLGRPTAVTARGIHNSRSKAIDQSQVFVEYADGSAMVDGGMMMPESYPFTATLEVLCERGALEYHFRAGGRSFEEGEPTSELMYFRDEGDPERLLVEQTDAFYNEVAYFLESVRNGQPATRSTPADALVALDVALAAQRSVDTGKRIVLE
jgi:predicted dehydrogenase